MMRQNKIRQDCPVEMFIKAAKDLSNQEYEQARKVLLESDDDVDALFKKAEVHEKLDGSWYKAAFDLEHHGFLSEASESFLAGTDIGRSFLKEINKEPASLKEYQQKVIEKKFSKAEENAPRGNVGFVDNRINEIKILCENAGINLTEAQLVRKEAVFLAVRVADIDRVLEEAARVAELGNCSGRDNILGTISQYIEVGVTLTEAQDVVLKRIQATQ